MNIELNTRALFFDTTNSPSFISYPSFKNISIGPFFNYGFRIFLNDKVKITEKFNPFISIFRQINGFIPNDFILGAGFLYSISSKISIFYSGNMAINILNENFQSYKASKGLYSYNYSIWGIRYYIRLKAQPN